MRALVFVLVMLGCASPQKGDGPTRTVASVTEVDAGPCGPGGVEMDDCYEGAGRPDGGACDVECRNGKLCLVRPDACRKAPIIIGPSEYLAPR